MELLLEEIKDQNRATIEVVQDLEVRLRTEITEFRQEFTARTDLIEVAVRQNSADIRQNSEDIRTHSEDIRQNSEDIRANTEAIARLEQKLDSKADRADLGVLEARVTALEAKER